ncbi:hypothetical protein PoB_006679000 [Plakobranchus ocellatus]|uniref:Uncharacterized protein n=1 Tax=Plakobranchus ocellatus TaxID=259542 RepID=A0AAV4D843_9GAST|nr:hypothetical protein PoB_006679000 [Plakobranchus ocellatus]
MVLAPKKNKRVQKVSLKFNNGILPRPIRRNILKERDPKNIVRIRGVDDSQENWIDLDAIHRFPINRGGNLVAPSKPHSATVMIDFAGIEQADATTEDISPL